MNQYTVWAKGLQVSEDLDLSQRNVGKALNRNNRWYQVSIQPKFTYFKLGFCFKNHSKHLKCTF